MNAMREYAAADSSADQPRFGRLLLRNLDSPHYLLQLIIPSSLFHFHSFFFLSYLIILLPINSSLVSTKVVIHHVRLHPHPRHRPTLRQRPGQAYPRPGTYLPILPIPPSHSYIPQLHPPTTTPNKTTDKVIGRTIRRKRMHPLGTHLPRATRHRRPTLVDLPSDHGNAETEGARTRPLEHVPTQEPLLAGGRVQ